MSLKDAIKKTVDNVADKASEIGHNANAETERASRDVAGDTMTTGEKIGSVANEAKERTLAGVDHAKVEVRKNT